MKMKMNVEIGFEELGENCFSMQTLRDVWLGRLMQETGEPGAYIIQLAWNREGLPVNQQVIWLLYHPDSMQPINRFFEDLVAYARRAHGRTVIIDVDGYDLSRDIMSTILMLSDGGFTCKAYSFGFEDGVEGHIGWIAGQGREIAENPDVYGILHAIISNIIGRTRELEDDQFIKYGLEEVEKIREILQKLGMKTYSGSIEPTGDFSISQLSQFLNPERDRTSKIDHPLASNDTKRDIENRERKSQTIDKLTEVTKREKPGEQETAEEDEHDTWGGEG